MRTTTVVLSIVLLAGFTLGTSCENEENENETVISSFNSDESHKDGQDCMNCHVAGGEGEGWFTVAGTVYDSTGNSTIPGSSVYLYSGPGGTGELVATVETDLKGNFYTTEDLDFGNGLYTRVTGETSTTDMMSKIMTGSCNSCHGASTGLIQLN